MKGNFSLGILLLVCSPLSVAGELDQLLAAQVGVMVDAVDNPRGYTTEKCASMKSLVEASIGRYRDPVCGGVGAYRAECDNVKYLKATTGANGIWADKVNRSVGVYLMRGGDVTVMPDLVYAQCVKKIGESNMTTLK